MTWPSHRKDIVHPNRRKTLGILVTDREPCLSLAHEDATKQTGRRFRVLAPSELAGFAFPHSWAMAVILCPGNNTLNLATWVKDANIHPGRISFYYHADTDYRTALAAWDEHGFEVTNIRMATHWSHLSKNFGAHLNSIAHDDFCPDPLCPYRELH